MQSSSEKHEFSSMLKPFSLSSDIEAVGKLSMLFDKNTLFEKILFTCKGAYKEDRHQDQNDLFPHFLLFSGLFISLIYQPVS